MSHQPLPIVCCPLAKSHNASKSAQTRQSCVLEHDHYGAARPRRYFNRSALFTALATSLVGFGVAPIATAAQNIESNNRAQMMTTEQPLDSIDPIDDVKVDSTKVRDADTDDTQLNIALDALRLKKAVEQGNIDQSVLDDYTEQNLGIPKPDNKRPNTQKSATTPNSKNPVGASNSAANIDDDFFTTDPNDSDAIVENNDDLLQQAMTIQQQGYQMMTPEQIDAELASLDKISAQDNAQDNEYNGIDSGFDAPVATLSSVTPPIGLDVDLDATSLPTPTNTETLGITPSAADRAEAAEIMSRPITVSDSVSSGRVDESNDLLQQNNPAQTLVNQNKDSVTGTDSKTDNISTAVNTGSMQELPTTAEQQNAQADAINPDDYLPDYETDTQAVAQSIEQAKKPKTNARNKTNIVKRLYNRLFNGGVMALPNIETTIYLQQAASDDTPNAKPILVEADDKIQPINNIKAALEDTNVQSVVDFTAALPRLRKTALDAARAVGYYDVTLRLRQPTTDTVEVIIEKLGEPVRVDSRIVDIRGEGSEQKEFQALEQEILPKEGDIFNHRVYKNSKAALEALSNTYGYFDQYWLNKSVDIILPDNTADMSLVYNTGERYEYDEVIFFTYDEASGTLTQDPDKLPVELSLLRQLYDFEKGDPFYRPAITKFSNDLSATRYFNTVNVESILPPDERSENSTLAFDNAPTGTQGSNVDSDTEATLDTNNSNDSTNNENAQGVGNSNNNNKNNNNDDINNASNNNVSADDNGSNVTTEVVAPIEFEVDQETQDKLLAIKQKAERLSGLPDNRVLDEKEEKAENILGRISDSISNIADKIFPEKESLLEDENFVPPTLAGRITPQQVAETKKVPLYVFVSANKPRDAQVGIGYGTDTGVRATAKVDYNLINRQGYQAGVETEISRINKNVSVYGSRPWNHPLNDKLEAQLTYKEEIIDQGEGSFELSTKTLKAALARNIRRESGWNRSYSVRYRLDELETGVEETELENLPVRFTSSNPTQQALLLGYGINKVDVDSVTNPTSGIRQYYSIEAGSESALSDTDLAIVRAGVSGIYSFGTDNKHQLLGSLDTGYIWADDFYDVPYKLRFFAGGDQSIRGYDYESLSPIDKGYLTGGQILAVGSAEYNYEFRPGFRGAVFTDVGNAYDKDFETDTKVGVGFGIRWASPVGVVRVDVAAGVTEESIPIRLHLFIGSPL